MSIVGNLSVLLTARVDGYRTDLGIARVETGRYKEVLESTGLSGKQFNQIMGEMRKAVFAQLPLQEQLAEEQRAVNYLFERGAISSQELDLSLNALNSKYQELTRSSKEFKDAERERQALASQLAGLESAARTPQQKFDDRIAEIQKLRTSGLSLQAANNEVFKAFQDFERESGEFDRKQGLQKELEKVEQLQRQRQAQIEALNRAAVSPEKEFRNRIDELDQLQKEGLSLRARNEEFLRAYQKFRSRSGADDRDLREQRRTDEFNRSAQRGLAIARPLASQMGQLKQNVVDLLRAERAGIITIGEFNKALAVQRDLYRSLTTGTISNAEAEKQAAALKTSLLGPQGQLNARIAEYRVLLDRGKISQLEFNQAVRLARLEIRQQDSALSKLLRPLNVLKTVGIGIAGARLFGGLFELADEPFQFERSITQAIAVFRSSGNLLESEIEGLRQAALAAGKDINNAFNSVDAAVALDKLARDGVQARLAIGALPTVMSFATAAQTDFAGAVDLVSEVTKVMVGNVDDANKQLRLTTYIMDLLAKGSTLSSSDVVDLSEALLKASPQAKELGLSARETTAAVLALSEVGRKGFVGGNEFRIAFRDLARAFSENEEEFRRFGIQVFDAQGKFRGVATVVEEMTTALDKLSPQSRGELLKIFGLQDKGAQFQLQLAGLAETVRDFDEKLQDVDGFAGALAADTLSETSKLIKRIRGEIVAFLNLTIVEFIEDIARGLNSLDASALKIAGRWIVMTGSFATFVLLAPRIVTAGALIVTAIQNISRATVLLQALSGPAGWATLLGGLVAAKVGVELFDSLMDDFGDSMEEPNEGLSSMRDLLKELDEELDRTTDGFNGVRQEYKEFADALREDLKDPADELFESFGNLEKAAQFLNSELTVRGRIKFIQDYVDAANQAREETDEIGSAVAALRKDLEEVQRLESLGFDGAAQSLLSDAIIRYRDALDDLANDRRLKDFAEQLAESTRKPVEILIDDLARIQEASSFLDETTRIRGITNAVDEYARALQNVNESRRLNAAADVFGSNAEFSQTFTVKSDPSESNPQVKQLKEMIKVGATMDQILLFLRGMEQRVNRASTKIPTGT